MPLHSEVVGYVLAVLLLIISLPSLAFLFRRIAEILGRQVSWGGALLNILGLLAMLIAIFYAVGQYNKPHALMALSASIFLGVLALGVLAFTVRIVSTTFELRISSESRKVISLLVVTPLLVTFYAYWTMLTGPALFVTNTGASGLFSISYPLGWEQCTRTQTQEAVEGIIERRQSGSDLIGGRLFCVFDHDSGSRLTIGVSTSAPNSPFNMLAVNIKKANVRIGGREATLWYYATSEFLGAGPRPFSLISKTTHYILAAIPEETLSWNLVCKIGENRIVNSRICESVVKSFRILQ